MTRIAKKSRPVKGLRPAVAAARGQKSPVKKGLRPAVATACKPKRFTVKKDTLGRRYALDKRTSKRAALSKAKKEQKSRKKAIAAFRGIITKKRSKAAKKGWETRRHNERVQAAKRGWETRRKKVIADTIIRERPPTFAEQEGALIPEGMRMRGLGGVADRSQLYPKVAAAANLAWIRLEIDAFRQREATAEGIRESTMYTPRFDRLYGEGHGTHVRFNFYAHARDLEDLDQIIDNLDQDEDNDYVARELYTLYFSPEVA